LTLLNITQSRSHLTSAAALAILRQSTALRTCDIVITDMEGEVGVPGEPFSLPELAHFSVRRNGVLPRDHLFGSLALPNLRDLEYY
jgi:alpha-D-ribose 1-methylphosphonate 5-triphosphate synthase subunit PhnG